MYAAGISLIDTRSAGGIGVAVTAGEPSFGHIESSADGSSPDGSATSQL
jgi:hypothetical protein